MPDTPRLPDVGPAEQAGMTAFIQRCIVLLLVVGLLIGVAAVLRPFTTAILFGATLAIAAWPLRRALIGWGLGRAWAGTLLLCLAIVVVALPVLIMAPALVGQLGYGMQRVQSYFATEPEQPAWLAGLPLVGARLGGIWTIMVRAEGDLGVALAPYSVSVRQMLITAAQALADSVVQVVLSLIVATMFWVSGDTLAEQLRDIFWRLGGETAVRTLQAAADAVRSVAYGVVGTAVVQAAILTLGLLLAGVPGAATLGFVGLLLAISQIGAPLIILIWGGAAFWLFNQDRPAWGFFMIAWGLLVSVIDNFLKPWLVGLGVHMPMSLTILGVFGGFMTFGFLGLFIGPTLIAAALVLLQAWRGDRPAREQPDV